VIPKSLNFCIYYYIVVKKMIEWREIGEEGVKRLYEVAKKLEGLKVRPSELYGEIYFSSEDKTFFTNAVAEIVRKCARPDLVGTVVGPNDYLLLKHFWLEGSKLTTYDEKGKLISESYLQGLLYLLMENSAGRVYYLKVGYEGRKPVADIRPRNINEIDRNSKVIAIIRPEKDEKGKVVRCGVITSKEYIGLSEPEPGFPRLIDW